MSKRIFPLLLILLSVVALAADRNPIPDPNLFIDADSYSIAVFAMRDGDAGVKAALDAALTSLNDGSVKLPPQFQELNSYLSGDKQKDVVFQALPFQGIRVDRMLPDGRTSPTVAATLAGYRGLQTQLYNTLAKGPDGNAFPSEPYRRTEIVARTGATDPTMAANLERVNGTLVFAATSAAAKAIADRLFDTKPVPKSALMDVFKTIPQTGDGYGVALNQKNSFSTLLKQVEGTDLQAIRNKIGSARLDKVVAATTKVVWQANIVDQNQIDGQVDLTMAPAAVADAVAAINDGQAGLDPTRVTNIAVTNTADTVSVKFSVLGVKQMILDYITKSGS